MDNININSFIEAMTNRFSFIAGFLNFGSLIDAEETSITSEYDIVKNSFQFIKNNNGWTVKIGIIISFNVYARIVVDQIREVIEEYFSSKKILLESVDIFIQGVK